MELFTSGFRRLGPLGPLVAFFFIALLFLGICRLCLVAWLWGRVAAVDGLWAVMGYGLRMDALLLSLFLALPALGSLLFSDGKKLGRIWKDALALWLTATAVFLVFMEVSTPSFISQYDSRPNRLFIEYLNHPREVFSTLWAAYRANLLVAAILVAFTVWGMWQLNRRLIAGAEHWRFRRRIIVLPLALSLLFIGARSSFDHRPANPSTAAFSSDHLVNELGLSSAYSVAYAIYSLKNEADAGRVYGKMAASEVVRRVKEAMKVPESSFHNPEVPTLHTQVPDRKPEQRLNVVIILEESLGAGYVQSLGGLALTPELEKLSSQGLWFEKMYSTGTRSVRGIEAVVTGFSPTPARSVVKLGLAQQNFFTLAQLLQRKGYKTEFFYGGDSQFDNMRGFFLGNGFERVVDEKLFVDPAFHGSWGVSDEDLFARAHQEFVAHGDEPFFALVFSSSNHSPYEFPDGRIELYEQPANTVNNAVKYADYALGRFFEQARTAPYGSKTLFLVVADHDTRVYGDSLVPIDHFHIPALIIGPEVLPARYSKVASQIDLAPTLLSLMGLQTEHPMQGHDLLRTPGDYPGRAIMQYGNNHAYMVGDQVAIHRPGKRAEVFSYSQGGLVPTGDNPELVQDALAHALWPSIAYREKRYHLEN